MRNFIHKKKIALGTGFCSIACMMMLGACDTVFDVHPYDVRVKGDTDLNAKNIRKIEEAVKSKDTIRFAVISDSRRSEVRVPQHQCHRIRLLPSGA